VRRPRTWWLAWGTWLFTLVLYGAAIAIIGVVGHSVATQQDTWAARGSLLAVFVAFATVGAFVSARQPRNAVGWMFLGIALLVSLSVFGGEYANYVFIEQPGSLPGGYLAGWLYLWTWFPALALITLVPLLFPDGRVPGPRWRPLLWTIVGFVGAVVVLWWVRPGPLSDPGEAVWPDNPIGIAALEPIYDHLEAVSTFVLVPVLVLTATAAVVRFRRSHGDQRQQLKWMTFGAVVWVVWVPLSSFITGDVGDVLFALTIGVLPAATAIAMFKYRLYDIDRVISRTLVYGSLTAILGAAYAGLVLAGQGLFSSFAGGSNLAIAVSTLAVAALFRPALRRIQAVVDRRFYRCRYDAARTLEAFGARLREEIDLHALGDDLRGVVVETMQPAHVSLWLRSEP